MLCTRIPFHLRTHTQQGARQAPWMWRMKAFQDKGMTQMVVALRLLRCQQREGGGYEDGQGIRFDRVIGFQN